MDTLVYFLDWFFPASIGCVASQKIALSCQTHKNARLKVVRQTKASSYRSKPPQQPEQAACSASSQQHDDKTKSKQSARTAKRELHIYDRKPITCSCFTNAELQLQNAVEPGQVAPCAAIGACWWAIGVWSNTVLDLHL